jgi:hypothetical protein
MFPFHLVRYPNVYKLCRGRDPTIRSFHLSFKAFRVHIHSLLLSPFLSLCLHPIAAGNYTAVVTAVLSPNRIGDPRSNMKDKYLLPLVQLHHRPKF